MFIVQDLMLYPVPYGALTQLYAGTAPEAAEYNGKVSNTLSSAAHTA